MEQTGLCLGCIVMAAGKSSRFGKNKLAEKINGQPLFLYALQAVPAEILQKTVVVVQPGRGTETVRSYGFIPVENRFPEYGVSHTIRLGLEKLGSCDGILFMVADQPMLQRESVRSLVERFIQDPQYIWALSHDGRKGNPCIFPGKYVGELMTLEGDSGGSAVIHAHPGELKLLEADARELYDVDTRESLNYLVSGAEKGK